QRWSRRTCAASSHPRAPTPAYRERCGHPLPGCAPASAGWSAVRETTAPRKGRLPNRCSCLFQLHQCAGEVLGMEEKDRLAMRPGFRLTRTEHPRPAVTQLVAGGEDVVNLIADV